MRSSRFDAFDSTWIRQTTIGLVALIAGLGATGASAVDGVLEISQACVSVGCFPGDVPGFPVTIGADATSYRLTSDLDTSPNTDVTAVVVTAPNTSLDLNGFSILGPATCTGAGSTLSCSGGTGVGISAINDEGFNIENGGVRGHPARGIVTGARARVQNVSVEASGTGIEVGDQSSVHESTAYQIVGDGISAGIGSIVDRSTSSSNGEDGIDVGQGSTVSGSTAMTNGSVGIRSGLGSSVFESNAEDNESDGINALAGSTVKDNTSRNNIGDGIQCGAGCTISGNTCAINDGDGITVIGSGLIIGNTLRSSGLFGLDISDDTAYAHNVLSNNNGSGLAPQVDTGVPIDGNLCVTNLYSRLCP